MRTAAEHLAPAVGLAAACRALGVARASVYRHRRPPVCSPRGRHRPSPRALAPPERAQVMDTPSLTLPHKEFRDRAFVLEPMAEIAPEAVDPITGLTVAELAKRPEAKGSVKRLDSLDTV